MSGHQGQVTARARREFSGSAPFPSLANQPRVASKLGWLLLGGRWGQGEGSILQVKMATQHGIVLICSALIMGKVEHRLLCLGASVFTFPLQTPRSETSALFLPSYLLVGLYQKGLYLQFAYEGGRSLDGM